MTEISPAGGYLLAPFPSWDHYGFSLNSGFSKEHMEKIDLDTEIDSDRFEPDLSGYRLRLSQKITVGIEK